MNREDWLSQLTESLRPLFNEKGFPLPEKIRVSVGFPSKSALSRKKTRVGECWDATTAKDGVAQVFISPLLEEDLKVGGVLVHELCHAAVGCACGHKGAFKSVARKVGLEGKLTATTEGPELTNHLMLLLDEIGPYPHSPLTPKVGEKKQTTRMLKALCGSGCDYIVRLTRKAIDSLGCPVCPGCQVQMVEEGGSDGPGD